ncbi:MAG: HIT domain-containing protein [Melioribacteraceae bacterium]|nr:HIT domain-containing protein [Melioribacteraceae bacterium]
MDRLWSPWRSQYIESFKDKKGDEGCIFCETAAKDVKDNKNLLVYKGEKAFVVLNLYPYNNGHMMVVPFRHISSLNELSAEENIEIMKLIQKSSSALAVVMKPHGFNIGANIGKAAGAGIDTHIHFHVLPRWNGDTNFMPALGEVKVISQDLLRTKYDLIDAFDKID